MAEHVKVLLSEKEVDDRIQAIGEQISRDYAGKQVHLICVLKGGSFFLCELAKRITVPVSLDFMSVSSYGSETKSSGVVKIIKDLDEPIKGKDCLLYTSLGGWIEVGQAVISQITQEMLLTVPEGSYQVRLTAGDVDETREVTIKRNEENVLDLGDIELKVPVNGQVSLVISPSTATVRIDDVTVNAAYAVRLPFGIHQITASADGYDTVSEYFEVTGENTRVKLTLGRAAEEDTVSGNSTKEEETPAHTVTCLLYTSRCV